MSRELPLRYQRAAAVLLLLAGGALVVTVLIGPFVAAYRERAADIAALAARIQHYRAAAREQPAFTQHLEQLQRDPLIASYHLRNATPALAAAELQQHIQKTVETHGGQLVSMQVIDTAAPSQLTTVTVRIRLRTDVEGLRNVLFALESARPLVTLDNVFLRTLGPLRGAGSAGTEPLDIGFDASGYLPGWTS